MQYRVDLFAVFILLGIVQAIFLAFFFLSRENRQRQFNIFQGLLLISIAACLLEILLMYTGYIIHILHLADFSEPAALLVGPFFYLFVLSLVEGRVGKKTLFIHITFPIIYTISLIPFLISSVNVKYNAWIVAYHPDWPLREWTVSYDPRMFALTHWHTQLVLISLGVYVLISGYVIGQSFREKRESFWKPSSLALRTVRNGVLQILAFSILIIIVKIFNKNDTGDHLFAAFASLLVYATSISVMNRSGFFSQNALSEQVKYKSSTLTTEQQKILIEKLNTLMTEEKPFLQTACSISDLGKRLGVSTHVLSQTINTKLGRNFFEMVAEYRVDEAKMILKKAPHLKIEEIAEQVGYSSKSSFNTAFKKIVGVTPSEYRSKVTGLA